MFKHYSVTDLYRMIMLRFEHMTTTCEPRGMPIREIRNAFITLTDPRGDLPLTASNERNAKMRAYSDAEELLYSMHTLQSETWAKHASKFWATIADEHGLINSNYGYLTEGLRDTYDGTSQMDWAYQSLTSDRDSRQAIVHFNRPMHQKIGVKDFPCTMHGIFFIRDSKLSVDYVMRSQDIVKGFPYDIVFFQKLLLKLSNQLMIDVGELTLHVHSLHLYERDLKTLDLMLNGDH